MSNDIDAYRKAIGWVHEVHPGATPYHAVVHLSWDEWNAMRALLELPKQVYCATKGLKG